ncbi:MAG: hypothetical protein HYX51_05085 [Chloroflexi bacterium]|nr:hypothetical protein [Chloroflexota bacterium]
MAGLAALAQSHYTLSSPPVNLISRSSSTSATTTALDIHLNYLIGLLP